MGDDTACTPTLCGTVVGACCSATGACTLRTGVFCLSQSNNSFIYHGDGSLCLPNPCQVGACCATDGFCRILQGTSCFSPSAYLGDGSACTPTSCQAGTCCDSASACTFVVQARCTAGSTWTFGGSCSPTACTTAQGACCIAGACTQETLASCTGYYAGDGAACTPSVCPVCCRGTTCTNTISSAAQCVTTGTAGAAFVTGASAACGGANHQTPCCYADYNKIGGRNVTDIFNYLTDWFAMRPWAVVGGTGTGTPAVGHIFAFLTDWFAGGCP